MASASPMAPSALHSPPFTSRSLSSRSAWSSGRVALGSPSRPSASAAPARASVSALVRSSLATSAGSASLTPHAAQRPGRAALHLRNGILLERGRERRHRVRAAQFGQDGSRAFADAGSGSWRNALISEGKARRPTARANCRNASCRTSGFVSFTAAASSAAIVVSLVKEPKALAVASRTSLSLSRSRAAMSAEAASGVR